jgi:hypothetical protein
LTCQGRPRARALRVGAAVHLVVTNRQFEIPNDAQQERVENLVDCLIAAHAELPQPVEMTNIRAAGTDEQSPRLDGQGA